MRNEYKVTENLLTINKFSRPGTKINPIKGIVIHWVANRNSTAIQNRNYFENRKYGKTRYGSAHEIIDLDGDIVKCISDDEVAYHVGSPEPYTEDALKYLSSYPNDCTYGIECTHVDWYGSMSPETYDSLVTRCAALMVKFNLTRSIKPLWLHQEVVGWKPCHKWFYENPEEWIKFKALVYRRCKILEGLQLEHEWQWKLLHQNLKALREEGVLNSKDWEEKALKKDISVHELTWLNTISLKRLMVKEV